MTNQANTARKNLESQSRKFSRLETASRAYWHDLDTYAGIQIVELNGYYYVATNYAANIAKRHLGATERRPLNA